MSKIQTIDKRRWVVAEVEHRIGFIGMTEEDAIADLKDRGFETYWMHYRDVWARPRLASGRRPRKPREVKRGYFAPFLFVLVDTDQPMKALEDSVGCIRDARHIADVLWSRESPLYLEPWFLPWARSVRIDPTTGIEQEPRVIDPEAGLFEPPPDRQRGAARYQPGDKVHSFDKWRAFDSVVKGIADGKVIVSHFAMFGREATLAYDPEHLRKEGEPE